MTFCTPLFTKSSCESNQKWYSMRKKVKTKECQKKGCYRCSRAIILIWETYIRKTLLWNESDTDRPRTVDFHYKRSPLLVNKKRRRTLVTRLYSGIYLYKGGSLKSRDQLGYDQKHYKGQLALDKLDQVWYCGLVLCYDIRGKRRYCLLNLVLHRVQNQPYVILSINSFSNTS